MKINFNFSCLLLLVLHFDSLHSQGNDVHVPCISEMEYAVLQSKVAHFQQEHPLGTYRGGHVSLLWPVKAAAALHDCSFYHVAAYVDHNAAGGAFQDFNCGTNSYDGHRGTDIATWPFNFYKMDNDLVEVVAAAAGTIVAIHDGEFDRNCSSNNLTANYVMVQHSDGSTALYWHMKKNSVTLKTVGQTVLAGERLGVVGSSGSASGPHLHFEVWAGADVSTRIDPFYGNCNVLNNDSWWVAQKPARETAVVRATVHSTDAVTPACPTTETPNASTTYEMPFQGNGLPAGYAKFYLFLRDEINGGVGTLSILNPDQSVFNTWTYTSPGDTKTKMFGWSKKLPTTAGVYTFTASYNNTTCSSTFEMTTAGTMVNVPEETAVKIYPNPSEGLYTLEADVSRNPLLVVYNILGEVVLQQQLLQQKTAVHLSAENAVYFYQLKEGSRIISTGKLLLN